MAGRAKELATKAYELAREYEKTYHGCGQCVNLALQDALNLRNDAVLKAATGLGGGVGMAGDSGCGSYTGSVLMMGTIIGRTRENMKDPEKIRSKTYALARKLHDRFIQEYGCVNCRDIINKLTGRYFYLAAPEEFEKFAQLGAHTTICPEVVGKAARWTVEILAEEGLLP